MMRTSWSRTGLWIWTVLTALSISLAGGMSLPSWYHDTDAISSFFGGLQKNCTANVQIEMFGTKPQLQHVTIQSRWGASSEKKNTMVLFGEHARELISPETAIQLAKDLCGQSKDPEVTALANRVLKHSTFQIVPNGNPSGRRLVEAGAFCRRTNENGVDLNRNWDDHWSADGVYDSDTYPGATAFSEPETLDFKAMAVKYPPSTFITVHSGTLGMYTPFAYTNTVPTEEPKLVALKKMQAALLVLDKKYCHCPSGAAGKEVGYLCPGTCLDYIYDKLNTSYSFAFEIYAKDEEEVHSQWDQAQLAKEAAVGDQGVTTLIERVAHSHNHGHSHVLSHHHNHAHGHTLPTGVRGHTGHTASIQSAKATKAKAVPSATSSPSSPPSCFLQAGQEAMTTAEAGMEPSECFGFFNPTDEVGYTKTIKTWSRLFLELTDMMHAGLGEAGIGAASLRFARTALKLEHQSAAEASQAVQAIQRLTHLTGSQTENAVVNGAKTLQKAAAASMQKAAAKRLRAQYRAPVFVHPYHTMRELDHDEGLISTTMGIDDGTLGYQDVENHISAGDPLKAVDTVGPGDGGGAAGQETEFQGRR